MHSVPSTRTFLFVLPCVLTAGYLAIAAIQDDVAIEIKANSVWCGTCNENVSPDYPMVLFIRSRNGNRFEGTNWYPSLDNGLVAISGQIIDNDTISFSETKVVHEGNAIAGGHYTARLNGKSLTGSYKIVLSPQEVDGGKFSLKLAN